MEKEKKEAQSAMIGERDFYARMRRTVEPYLSKHGKDGFMRSYDGTRIYYRIYDPGEPRGRVVLVHGFCEFIEKYNEMVYYFLQKGYAVYMIEMRGHGNSQRSVTDFGKVHVRSFTEYVKDLHEFVRRMVPKDDLPRFLFGHSMGGAIAAMYLEHYPRDFRRAVLSSPMMRLRAGKFPYALAVRLTESAMRRGHGSDYAYGQHSFADALDFESSCFRSRARYRYIFEKRRRNILYQTSGATFGWLSAAFACTDKIREISEVSKIKIPVLVMASGDDNMVYTEYTEGFARALPNGEYVCFPNARHEIFHSGEEDRKEFYGRLFAFYERD